MKNLEADTATKFAVQTAIMSVLTEELIEKEVVERDAIVRKLYDLLQDFALVGEKPHNAGAIRHLISLLEEG